MQQLQVWHPVNKTEVPPNRRLIKHRWVFDIKRTGIFRARLVACGYSQIPGVDFQDFYSPVVNDAVFRILIILQLTWHLTAVIIDIETAFLHGNLDESIYMTAPKGSAIPSHQCVHLDKAIYGLVQAARQFYIKFASVLKQIKFTVSYADPCLFYRNNDNGRVIMVIHIDDCYVIGDKPAIKQFVQELEQHGLKAKVSPAATDYLSCDILTDYDKKIAWIGQPTLMKKVIKEYGAITTKMGTYNFKTPGTPGYLLIKPTNDIGILSPEDQSKYRSGVGTLLQFANKTRPDITNPVRELSKGMDKATPSALKEMYRIIKYLIQTKDYGLKLAPTGHDNMNDDWKMTIYTDSDWASCKDDRKSITGFAIFLIMWRSQSQKCVSLSSTEAEYYATSEATKEIKFIVQVMESLGLKVEKPIIVRMDNVGAIFVAENASATKHTRHIDARYHFVREYVIEGTIRIMFVSSKENKADTFTKNVTSDIYEEHMDDYIIQIQVIKVSAEDLLKPPFVDSGGVSGLLRTSNESYEEYKSKDKDLSVADIKVRKFLEGTYVPESYLRKNLKSLND
jgi:Reverse transcriptase (RNA-dependent DNA polymerase)